MQIYIAGIPGENQQGLEENPIPFRKETFKLIIGEKTDAKKKKNQRNKST